MYKYVAVLDTRKAFDTVWHYGLFWKLYQKGLNAKLWRILWMWYRSSQGVVVISNVSSKVYNVLQGVRQGGVLSMSLYQVYIADLLTQLKSSGCGIYHDGHYYGSPCFADDLVLIAPFTKTLCKMLDIATDYANMWRYSFNVKKSAILAYTKPKVNLDKIADISCVDEVTHVGIPL